MSAQKLVRLFLAVVLVLMVMPGFAVADNQDETAVEKINLNTATVEMLTQLNGVGETYARRIIEYREANGLFSHIEEMKNVKGIGDKIFEKNKNRITVEMETTDKDGSMN